MNVITFSSLAQSHAGIHVLTGFQGFLTDATIIAVFVVQFIVLCLLSLSVCSLEIKTIYVCWWL